MNHKSLIYIISETSAAQMKWEISQLTWRTYRQTGRGLDIR